MAVCQHCRGDQRAYRQRNRPIGTRMELYWLCDACFTGLPSVPEVKRRGLAFYRRVTYQIVIPVMATIFALIEIGLHL